MSKIKVYHLSSCSTCKRIFNELKLPEGAMFQCIKENPIKKEELEKIDQTKVFEKKWEKI